MAKTQKAPTHQVDPGEQVLTFPGYSAPEPEATERVALPTPPPSYDDLASLVVAQELVSAGQEIDLGEKIVLGKPGPTEAFRIHGGPEWSSVFYLLTTTSTDAPGGNRAMRAATYVVAAALVPELLAARPGLLKARRLFWWITAAGTMGVWPVSLPEATGSSGGNNWVETSNKIAALARTGWFYMTSDVTKGKFRAFRSPVRPDPVWPDLTCGQVLARVFGTEGIVGSMEHLALANLVAGVEVEL